MVEEKIPIIELTRKQTIKTIMRISTTDLSWVEKGFCMYGRSYNIISD